MSSNDDSKREFWQLWLVAKYYFDIALEYYQQIGDDQLSLTVGEIAEKFKTTRDIVGMKQLILSSANFSLCSVRLYIIDEKQNEFQKCV